MLSLCEKGLWSQSIRARAAPKSAEPHLFLVVCTLLMSQALASVLSRHSCV